MISLGVGWQAPQKTSKRPKSKKNKISHYTMALTFMVILKCRTGYSSNFCAVETFSSICVSFEKIWTLESLVYSKDEPCIVLGSRFHIFWNQRSKCWTSPAEPGGIIITIFSSSSSSPSLFFSIILLLLVTIIIIVTQARLGVTAEAYNGLLLPQPFECWNFNETVYVSNIPSPGLYFKMTHSSRVHS